MQWKRILKQHENNKRVENDALPADKAEKLTEQCGTHVFVIYYIVGQKKSVQQDKKK